MISVKSSKIPAHLPSPLDLRSLGSLPIKQLLAELETNPEGLTSREADRRLGRYGANDVSTPRRPSMWWQFFGRFRNPLVLILLAASVISAVTGDVSSFVIVITIVVLSVVMDFIQEQRAEYAIDALRAKVALRAQAIRDGSSAAVLVSQLVPGDIVELNAGDLVPADGRLLSAHDFFVNQALLTGEPYPVEKHAVDTIEVTENRDSIAENITLAGSSVISGEEAYSCEPGASIGRGSLIPVNQAGAGESLSR